MPRALCLLREDLHYRREAFCAGLRAAGHDVVTHLHDPHTGDVLAIWNRYGRFHAEACRFERAGATVLVAENGYLGKHWRGGEWFSMAVGHHGGAGRWRYGGPERWDGRGIDLAPWRQSGRETVILGQRSIGEPGLASPHGWERNALCRLPAGPVRVRPHPGVSSSNDLLEDLRDAQAVVTWSSGAALKALAAGIPVWRDSPWWIGAAAGVPIGEPLMRDDDARLGMFRRMAWCTWEIDEIRSGEAFRWLVPN